VQVSLCLGWIIALCTSTLWDLSIYPRIKSEFQFMEISRLGFAVLLKEPPFLAIATTPWVLLCFCDFHCWKDLFNSFLKTFRASIERQNYWITLVWNWPIFWLCQGLLPKASQGDSGLCNYSPAGSFLKKQYSMSKADQCVDHHVTWKHDHHLVWQLTRMWPTISNPNSGDLPFQSQLWWPTISIPDLVTYQCWSRDLPMLTWMYHYQPPIRNGNHGAIPASEFSNATWPNTNISNIAHNLVSSRLSLPCLFNSEYSL